MKKNIVDNIKRILSISIIMSICTVIMYASGVDIHKKKQTWKRECRQEYLDKNRIFAHDGKNHRAILRITNCIDLVSDYCITYLKGQCPAATKQHADLVKNANQANRTRDALIKFGE